VLAFTNTTMNFMWKMMITYLTSNTLIAILNSFIKWLRLWAKDVLVLSKKSGK